MWKENDRLKNAKASIETELRRAVSGVTTAEGQVHDIISALNAVTAGSVTGMDRQVIDACQQTLSKITGALRCLYNCQRCAGQLETKEWVEDKAGQGGVERR